MKHSRAKQHLAPIWRRGEAYWAEAVRTVSAHPRRVAGVGAVCAGLLVLVATTTLPMALAPSAPGLARLFNSRDPEVLRHAADEARMAFFGLDRSQPAFSSDEDEPATTPSATPSSASKPGAIPLNTIALLPEAPPPAQSGSTASGTESEQLRDELRRRAAAIIAVDPLNPVAFRMQAEAAEDPDAHRSFMIEAAKRSRRDPETLLWLIENELQHNRYDAALGQVDILLRSHSRFSTPVFMILGRLAENADGRPALVQWLTRTPEWRESFFRTLNRTITQADTPFLLMEDLKQAGQPPSDKEINQYLSFLLTKGFPQYAYNVWVQTLPPEVLSQTGFLNNPSFERVPNGSPFDWRIATPRNAIGEFIPLPDLGGQRAFHVVFGSGRVRFPELSQALILPPGRYRLDGRLRGSIVGKRGLVWQVQCLYRRGAPLGQTEQLLGQALTWRIFSFDFEVPDTPECMAQRLRLFHDARSASEEIVSGEVWFDDLTLQRITEHTN